MTLLDKNTRLSDALMEFPELIPIIDRMGISPGFAEKSIESICKENNVDVCFFLAVINLYIDNGYFPANLYKKIPLHLVAAYLRKTSGFYLRIQLPNIDRHFESLLDKSGKENNLDILYGFYTDVRNQLIECLKSESSVIFNSLDNGIHLSEFHTLENSFNEVEEKLHDLFYFFVAHLHGTYDHNLCNAVITSISMLWHDFKQNNRIRTRIIIPLASEFCKNSNCIG